MLRDPNDRETAAKVIEIFGKIAAAKGPINSMLNQADIKKLEAIPSALVMLDAAPGVSFDEHLTGPAEHEAKDYRGTHGQLPSRVEMRSSLIVYGATARVGAKMALARMIDIGPTAAAVLGLRFAKAEGTPIGELLKPGIIPPAPKREKKKTTNE